MQDVYCNGHNFKGHTTGNFDTYMHVSICSHLLYTESLLIDPPCTTGGPVTWVTELNWVLDIIVVEDHIVYHICCFIRSFCILSHSALFLFMAWWVHQILSVHFFFSHFVLHWLLPWYSKASQGLLIFLNPASQMAKHRGVQEDSHLGATFCIPESCLRYPPTPWRCV